MNQLSIGQRHLHLGGTFVPSQMYTQNVPIEASHTELYFLKCSMYIAAIA